MYEREISKIERPKVGVGLLIVKNELILLGKRRASHGSGEYAGPGGHMEGNETFEETAMGELREEAGDDIRIKNLGFLCVTNLRKYLPKHYVDIGMVAEWESGDPIVMEPDKLESWEWHPFNNLPQPLFGCVTNYVKAYQTGQRYFAE